MAKTFRVGVVGNQDNSEQSYYGFMYGVEVFDLTADQICTLLENPDPDKSMRSSQPGLPAPVMMYEVMGGGRFYPGVSREELSKAVEGIEILIARMSSVPRMYSFMSFDFYQGILSENLADKCKIVIARITTAKEPQATAQRSHSRSTTKPKDLLKIHGLNAEQLKYNGKVFIITDSSKVGKTKGKKTKNSSNVSIDKVRSELSGEELKVAITQPVKETVTAGKAIAGLGARMGRWFSSLIKSQ